MNLRSVEPSVVYRPYVIAGPMFSSASSSTVADMLSEYLLGILQHPDTAEKSLPERAGTTQPPEAAPRNPSELQ